MSGLVRSPGARPGSSVIADVRICSPTIDHPTCQLVDSMRQMGDVPQRRACRASSNLTTNIKIFALDCPINIGGPGSKSPLLLLRTREALDDADGR